MRRSLAIFALLLAGTATGWAQSGETPEPLDVKALVEEAHRNGARMAAHINEYTWTETAKLRLYDRRGKLKEETPLLVWEIFPNRVSGRRILRKLVSEDDVAVSAERAEKELKRLAGEIEKDEREAERRGVKEREKLLKAGAKPASYVPPGQRDCTRIGYVTTFGNNGGLVSFSLPDFLCAGEFHSPRREQLNGREAIVLSFRARPDYVPPSEDRAPIARMAGAVWIDSTERVVLRLEAWPATERDLKDGAAARTTSRGEEAAVVYEEIKIGEGMWMRGLSRIDTTRNPAFFDKVNVYFNGVFSDYRRFDAEFESYKLTAPKAQD
jgi:hypothetical protein